MIEAPMGDARFFARTGPYALADIANAAVGTAPAINRMFAGVAPLQSAGRDEVSFLDNRRYVTALEQTMAGAVIVHPQMQARVPSSTIAIVTASTYEAWARVAALFHPVPAPRPGIHPSALVDREARVDASAEIGPYAVVEARAEIGPGCRIGSFVSIGAGVDRGPRLPHRRPCQPQSCLAWLAGLHLPGRQNRSGGLQLRHDQDRLSQYPAAWSCDRGGRCGSRGELDDRSRIDP